MPLFGSRAPCSFRTITVSPMWYALRALIAANVGAQLATCVSLAVPLLEAVEKWTFKPAMCGTEPVVSEVYESFDYVNTVARQLIWLSS